MSGGVGFYLITHDFDHKGVETDQLGLLNLENIIYKAKEIRWFEQRRTLLTCAHD